MSCRKNWPRSFMAANFTQKFMNKTYKEHRENVLLDREKALMPETQTFVELELEMRKLTAQKYKATNKIHHSRIALNRVNLLTDADISARTGLTNDFDIRVERLRLHGEKNVALATTRAEFENIDNKIKLVGQYRFGHRQLNERVRRAFVRACPAPDCKGFLSTSWECGICEKKTCSDCHEVKTSDDHTCDPSSVETARLLARDSRPCPSCASMIFKIDGCDQMWCTQCHTAFSWRHGTIVTSIVHNPHYYDYMRANGGLPRNPMDRPCGGIPDWSRVVTRGLTNHAIYRAPIHAHQVLMPSFDHRHFDPNHNRELRIKFMLNELTDDKFKIAIQRDEKSRQKNNDIYNVLEMFVNVMTDILQRYVATATPPATEFGQEFENLRMYVNDNMSSVSRNFSNCRVPRLGVGYAWDM